ncbi:MAG: hypothetical protein QNI90_11485 [Dinoroseobacter sp.]|nr:hypothetical protein [Dinoroseobacter sp.]MDJ0994190.1 hypothetical protein [Dinoroseobacter sp.]
MHDDSSQPPQPAATAVDLRTSIDEDWALVRDLIQKSEDLEAAASEVPAEMAAPPEEPSAAKEAQLVAEPQPEPEPVARRRMRLPSLKLKAPKLPPLKRPSRRSVSIAGLCLFLAVLVLRPGLVLGLIFLGLCIALAICAALGPERLAPLIRRLHQQLKERSPKRADQLLRGVGLIADILPPRWRYGFDLPDMPAAQNAKHDIALDRLSRMAAER